MLGLKRFTAEKIYIGSHELKLFVLFSVIGLVTFSSLVIYELPNPDAIWCDLYYKDSWGWECKLGRYMIRFFQTLFGNVINTSAFTLLCIFVLAIIGVIVVNIFDLKGISAIFCGIMVILSPTVVSTLSYYYCSLYYMIAYLFAVLTAWIGCKRKDWISAVIGAALLCISMATYQAYIGVVLVLAVIFVVFSLLDVEMDVKAIFYRIMYLGGIVAGGIISYLISCKVLQKVFGVVAESGRGFSAMGSIPLDRIGELVKKCYVYVYQYFLSTEMINNSYGYKKILNFLIMFVFLIAFAYKIIKTEKKWYYKAMAVIGILVFPLALMSITVAASGVSIYDTTGVLMLPTMNYVYIFFLILLYKMKSKNCVVHCMKWSGMAVALIMAISLYNFCISAQSYQKYSMNKMDYLAKSITYDIEKQIDNSGEYVICFVGQAEKGNYPEVYPELLDSLHWVTASYGTIWDDFLGTQECWKAYIKQYTGKQYKRCSEEEYEEIINSEFFHNMNNYPDENSVSVYNDSVVVVRLSGL